MRARARARSELHQDRRRQRAARRAVHQYGLRGRDSGARGRGAWRRGAAGAAEGSRAPAVQLSQPASTFSTVILSMAALFSSCPLLCSRRSCQHERAWLVNARGAEFGLCGERARVRHSHDYDRRRADTVCGQLGAANLGCARPCGGASRRTNSAPVVPYGRAVALSAPKS